MGSRGSEPAAASGGNRQAEHRKSQGVPLAARLCEFPGLKSLAGSGAGSGAAPQAGGWGQGPHRLPSRSDKEKNSQGAKRYLTGNLCKLRYHYRASKQALRSNSEVPVVYILQRKLQHSKQPAFHSAQRKPDCSITDRQVTLRSLTVSLFDRFAIRGRWGFAPNPIRDSSPGNSHSRAASVAPCDFQRFACLHPAQRAAGSGSLNPARGSDPGNSHSRTASGAPCDSRRSACLFPPLAAAGFSPLDPTSLRAGSSNSPYFTRKYTATSAPSAMRYQPKAVKLCFLM